MSSRRAETEWRKKFSFLHSRMNIQSAMPENLIEVETRPLIQIHSDTQIHFKTYQSSSGQNKEPTLISLTHAINGGFPDDSVGTESTCSADDMGCISGSGRSWMRAWQLTLVFLPRERYEVRSLMCYSPKGCKESEMVE